MHISLVFFEFCVELSISDIGLIICIFLCLTDGACHRPCEWLFTFIIFGSRFDFGVHQWMILLLVSLFLKDLRFNIHLAWLSLFIFLFFNFYYIVFFTDSIIEIIFQNNTFFYNSEKPYFESESCAEILKCYPF